MEQLGPLLIEFLYFVAFYRNIFFNVFYVCYSFSKTVNAWYNVLELATIYVHLCNCQVKVKYWGMSDDVPRMISVLLKFIFVSDLIEIQALTLVQRALLTTFIKEVVICFLS